MTKCNVAMKKVNYHNRQFIGLINYDDGDFTSKTIFHYHQNYDVVWGTYKGGGVRFGTSIATLAPDGSLDIRWQHVNNDGQIKTGKCWSVPELLPDGRIRLHESWQINDGPSGTSIAEEARPGKRMKK
jgi:hypothetical protein